MLNERSSRCHASLALGRLGLGPTLGHRGVIIDESSLGNTRSLEAAKASVVSGSEAEVVGSSRQAKNKEPQYADLLTSGETGGHGKRALENDPGARRGGPRCLHGTRPDSRQIL